MSNRLRQICSLWRAVGALPAASLLVRRAFRIQSASELTAAGDTRIRVRPCDSDLFVALQVFGNREYDLGPARTQALIQLAKDWKAAGIEPVILDAGANVGYSALFFARTFPDTTVLAVEPDEVTFQQLRHNCAQVARIKGIRVALWSHEDGVSLEHSERLKSWATRVSDGGVTPSMRLSTLMASVPNARPLILKFDIEGAEREVIESAQQVVREAPCILVEPHDFLLPGHGSIAPLFSALAGKRMDTTFQGENLVFFDSDLLEASSRQSGLQSGKINANGSTARGWARLTARPSPGRPGADRGRERR